MDIIIEIQNTAESLTRRLRKNNSNLDYPEFCIELAEAMYEIYLYDLRVDGIAINDVYDSQELYQEIYL